MNAEDLDRLRRAAETQPRWYMNARLRLREVKALLEDYDRLRAENAALRERVLGDAFGA